MDTRGVVEESTSELNAVAIPRMSWGAVFAGVLGALGAVLVMGLLGVAVGATAAKPAEAGGLDGIGMGAGIWTLSTFLVAIGLGGWIAARLSGVRRSAEGILHGVVVWSCVMLLTFTLVGTGVAAALKGALGFLGGAAQQTLATARETTNPEATFEGLKDRVSSPEGREQAQRALIAVGMRPQEARELIAEVGKSAERGQNTPELDRKIENAKQQAAVRAQEATKAFAKGAWWTLAAVVFALGAGIIGGLVGAMGRTMPGRMSDLGYRPRLATAA